MKRNFNLICGILVLCLVSNFSNGATATKLPFYYSMLYPQTLSLSTPKHVAKANNDFMEVPYSISASACGSGETIVNMDDFTIYFDSSHGELQGDLSYISTYDTYSVWVDNVVVGTTLTVNTDAGYYTATLGNDCHCTAGTITINNVVVNTSASISVY